MFASVGVVNQAWLFSDLSHMRPTGVVTWPGLVKAKILMCSPLILGDLSWVVFMNALLLICSLCLFNGLIFLRMLFHIFQWLPFSDTFVKMLSTNN